MAQATVPELVQSLQEEARRAYLRDVRQPHVQGNDKQCRRLWFARYAAKAAAHDQNPVFAAKILPSTVYVSVSSLGLPLHPAGIRYVVDDTRANTMTVSVEVAGPITLTLLSPVPGVLPQVGTPTYQPTRGTATFNVLSDGIYTLQIAVGLQRLAGIYVLVQRANFRAFRERVRLLAYDFRGGKFPLPDEETMLLLALMMAAEAAAQTGQKDLCMKLYTAAGLIEHAPTPVAISRP